MSDEIYTTGHEQGARERVSVVAVGHVDHGKSTLIGRLLADAGALPDGKIDAIREYCARNSRPFEYAYLLDALKDEQSQGITLDSARCFFKSTQRDYVIIDAPGHIEFLKNMVSGAARADAALLVIDAQEGVQENSRRHGYFLSMLGIDQFAVVINKMDLVGYDRTVFEAIEREYRAFLRQIGMEPLVFIAVDSRNGVNLVFRSDQMSWYAGPTMLEVMDRFSPHREDTDKPLRLPLQDVYKFTAMGDHRRILVGRLESGTIKPGDTILFSPSNKRTVLKTLEVFNSSPRLLAGPGESIGLTLVEQIYVTRGEMISRNDQPSPNVTSRFRADLFWLGKQSMHSDKPYTLKLGTAEVDVHLEHVVRILDTATLAVIPDRQFIDRHEVAECVLCLGKPIAFDLYSENPKTGRFVIVDDDQICGGGIVREALADEGTRLRQEVSLRDKKWIRSRISPEMRASRFGQQPALIVITGPQGVGRKQLARALELELFKTGRMVYYLGMGSVVYGVDADILASHLESDLVAREHIRRFGEVLHVLLDAGLVVICTALNLTEKNRRDIETLVGPARMISIRVGDFPGGETDLFFNAPCDTAAAVPRIINYLNSQNILSTAH